MRAIEPLFHRAPNAHNTQPWRLEPDPVSGTVLVGWDPRYALGPSDPSGRDLRLSLGTFVESCLVVCAAEGVAAQFVADYDPAACRVGRFAGSSDLYRTSFTRADVAARRSWRGAWTDDPLPDDLLAELARIAHLGGGRLVHMNCRSLYRLLGEASQWFFADAGIVAELRTWVRLTRRHPDYGRDGLSAAALALRPYEATAMRMALQPRIWGKRALRRTLARGQSKAFASPGTVLVLLGTSNLGESGEVEFGRCVQRLWLALAHRGFSAHPQSHLIDCPRTVHQVGQAAGAIGERPLWVARVGRPDPAGVERVPRSARRVTFT